jgi:hypothetical protein
MHRVGIDGDLLDDVTNGRELVARPQDAKTQGLADLVHHLSVRRYAGFAIEPEL